MHKKDLKYYVGFSMIPGIGAARGNRLVNYFDLMENAWNATETDLARAGLDEKTIAEVVDNRKKIDLDFEIDKIKKEGIEIITIKDKSYPSSLKDIFNPPFLLFYRGEIKSEDEYAFAIVGARKYSDYGRRVTEEISNGLLQNKVTLVSGFAMGIDGVAHKTALDFMGGRTIAVLGSGIDDASIYPKENLHMVEKIINGRGAIISEYPIGTPPLKQNFPSRNRIISGLSRGVLVVEATGTSGSLITATLALEQGKDVFAVPGNIFSKNSEGPHKLIKMGAKLTEKTEDILEELDFKVVAAEIEAKKILPENENEEKILRALELENKHVDEIVLSTGIGVSDLNACLVTMEMKGIVRNIGGGNYMLGRK